ncbi:MAG TPA: precorrin-8X methylmutase [Methylomusa anaerophila]|uniref:Precorrin-8X methylmutase n=1 Tax=Methylomusa anaerophila TaxID=1930071 RepID=A0A348AM77_9FIRM|nr:precorrin-8X methylmutase [Methylomusa anaerophila]BBB92175.1 precorrin-8X methylmutase [Methylomusa anaerophila]HML87811.1 precorrin-8X methylmutase [Methylomusa anaerophila]
MEYIMDPGLIETRSMEIIGSYLDELGLELSPAAVKVYSRIIHAAGDPDYAKHIRIHPDAITAGCAALAAGRDIYCDVEMVRTGINKRLSSYGGKVYCLIGSEETARLAKSVITRAMSAAIRQFGGQLDGVIVAIGNAPAALFELSTLMERTGIRPALVIGVPAGFVGAAESKALLHAASPVPYITVLGNKGGSPIAVAALDALWYMTETVSNNVI